MIELIELQNRRRYNIKTFDEHAEANPAGPHPVFGIRSIVEYFELSS